ncbi:hypothetical protein [Aeromicrobium sp. IC_218]|uniref:hypothetical protein n=1 Tax=Aeromicrobium sp. IC_218 TaxID=2545468 RepID=UPI00103C953B|nr:hypothetical protein [Aeromicrobium sp. IC_218]TCI98833.1 hypothetical protein E0W78_08755 [Aeromicrobium sp. IC_218]
MSAADRHVQTRLDTLNEQTARTNALLGRLLQQVEYQSELAYRVTPDSPPPPHLARRQPATS